MINAIAISCSRDIFLMSLAKRVLRSMCTVFKRHMPPYTSLSILLLWAESSHAEESLNEIVAGYWPAWFGLATALSIILASAVAVRKARQQAETGSSKVWTSRIVSGADLEVLLDSDGKITEINRGLGQLKRLIGVQAEALIDKKDRSRWKRFLADFHDTTAGSAVSIFKARLPNRRISYWEVLLSSSGRIGTPAAVVCSARDVTEAHRKEITRDVLNTIAVAASHETSFEDLITIVSGQLERVVDVSNFYVVLYDSNTNCYRKAIARDIHAGGERSDESLDLAGGLTDHVRKTGEPCLLNDSNREQFAHDIGIRSIGHRAACWLGVPLRVRSEVTGVFVLQSYTNPKEYTEADLKLLSIVSGSIGRALERRQAQAELQEHEARLRILTERMPALIWTQNLCGEINYVSGAALQRLDCSADDLVGHRLCDMLEYFERTPDQVLERLNSGNPLAFRLRARGLEFNAYVEPSYSQGGTLVGAIGVALDVTDLVQKDEELKQYFQLSSDVLLILNREGRVLRCNEALTRILGHNTSRIIGEDIFELVCPDDRHEVSLTFCEHASSQLPSEREIRLIHRDGEYRWMTWCAVQLPDLTLFVSCKDITYRREIENSLREREEQLRTFVEYSPAPMAMFDRDMRYLVVSKRWYQAYRLEESSIIGKSHYEVFPEIPERWKEIHWRCLRGDTASSAKDAFPRADGSTDWVRWEIRPWYAATGEVGGIIMLTEVITAEVEAETELLRSKTLARQIVDSSLDAVVAMDSQGFVTEWNPQAEAIFGFTKAEAVGEFLHNLIIPAGFRESHRRGLQNYLQTGNGQILNKVVHFSARRKDGSEFPIELTVTAIDAGEHPHFAGIVRDISERTAQEQALRESKEKLKEAQQIAGLGFFEWYVDTDHLEMSDEKLRMIARPGLALPLTFETFLSFVHSDDRHTFTEAHSKVFEGMNEVELEYRILRDNGEIRYLLSRGKASRRADGSLEKIFGTTLDITERVRSEQRRMATEQRLAIAIEGSNDAFWDLNCVSGDCYCSPRFVQWLEYEPEQFVYHESFLNSHVAPESMQAYRDAFVEHAAGRVPAIELEILLRTARGNTLWIYTRGKIVEWNDDGTPLRCSGFSTNITARKRLEARATQLGRILDNALNEVYIIDPTTLQIIEANQRASTRTGYSRAELQSLPAQHLLAPWAQEQFFEIVSELQSGVVDVVSRRCEHICKNGDHYPFETTLQFMEWHDRRVIVSIGVDVSERLKVEAEHESLQNQLRHAQRMETIGTLAGGIAHDFNNILTPILGYADMIACELPEGAPIRQDIEQVVKAAYRAKGLVQQILAFSRRDEQAYVPLKIEYLVKEALKLLRSSLPANVELIHDIKAVGDVLSDATQIHQVVMNLCTNAYQALGRGGGVVEVELSEVTLQSGGIGCPSEIASGRYACLSVTDSGLGMDEHTVSKIFEPFFTTKEVGEGTGLGLSVVHGIVTSHRGAIHVESKPGKGTRVTVWLPIVESAAGLLEQPRIEHIAGNEHILLCDDDETIALLGKQMLESLGYQVTACNDPVEALVQLQIAPIAVDVVIVDDMMPILSGEDVARATHDFDNAIPVVLLASGGLPDALSKDCFAGFVSKPVGATELAAAVRKALSVKSKVR